MEGKGSRRTWGGGEEREEERKGAGLYRACNKTDMAAKSRLGYMPALGQVRCRFMTQLLGDAQFTGVSLAAAHPRTR